MNYVKLIAPAKINLVLAVGEKLPDGYHEAHTILAGARSSRHT